MHKYVVNSETNGWGSHDIHVMECDLAEKISGVLFLGRCVSGNAAKSKAAELGYQSIECCEICLPECNTRQQMIDELH